MAKFKVCVTKIMEHFEILEIDAETDLDARRKAILLLKNSEEEYRWTEAEKPRYKAEVVEY